VLDACSQFGDSQRISAHLRPAKAPEKRQEQLFCRFPKPDVADSSPFVRLAAGRAGSVPAIPGSCRFGASLPDGLLSPQESSFVHWGTVRLGVGRDPGMLIY
jgi:hypothetical protein